MINKHATHQSQHSSLQTTMTSVVVHSNAIVLACFIYIVFIYFSKIRDENE